MARLVRFFSAMSLVLFTAVLPCAPAWTDEYSDTFATGDEWTFRMTPREKLLSLVVPIVIFHKYGVPLNRTPEEYIDTIDKVLLYNPYLGKEDISNIFASTVYVYEPESRQALELMALSTRLRDDNYRNMPIVVPAKHAAENDPIA